jgi:hypothetical protein
MFYTKGKVDSDTLTATATNPRAIQWGYALVVKVAEIESHVKPNIILVIRFFRKVHVMFPRQT